MTTGPWKADGSPDASLYSGLEHVGATDAVVRRIQGLILDDRLHPGDPLPPERSLADTFEVGRNVVREALRILEEKGLVEVVAGRGTFVAEPDPSNAVESLRLLLRRGGVSLMELSDARLLIEPEMAALAAQNATSENTRELKEWLRRLEEASHDSGAHVQADIGLHKEIARLSNHAVFRAIVEAVSDVVLWSMRLGTTVPGAIEASDERHRALVAAIAAGDAEAARREMKEHIRFVAEYAQKNVSKRSGGRGRRSASKTTTQAGEFP